MIDAHLLEAIGDAPEHVAALRKLAVAFAVGGHFDRDNTVSASELLISLEAVKNILREQGKIGKKKSAWAVPPEHLPEVFDDPTKFVPLGQIARVEKGKTGIKKAVPGCYPLVVTAAARETCDHFDFEGAAVIIPLVSSTGHGNASINRLHYQEGQFALGTILAAVFPHDPNSTSARFLFEYLSAYKDELLVSRMTGTANVTLSIGRIAEVPVPLLSPIAQAKVDELMALCDRLEEARKTREKTRDKLTAASLTRLTAPETSTEEFPSYAQFALDALPSLTSRPEQIRGLRQTILNLAVRGKLVEQDPADEPAEQLLSRIAEGRTDLLAAGYPTASEAKTQQKKQKQQSIPEGLEKLPLGWSWSTLQQCSLMVIDCKNKTAPYSQSGIRLIRTTNVRDGKLNSKDQKFVNDATYEAWSLRGKPAPGDILITREAPMGEVCIIPEDEQICLGQRMMLARLVPNTIDTEFLLYSLCDPNLMDRVQDKPLGMTVQHLRVGGVETLLVPLPPLAEQRRIAAKVDALMALCDRLENALTEADTTRTRLLEALLHEALEPTTGALEAAE
ncbi:restriction endonuclease subunit S [Phaeobacter inhibens]|uniref:restriction endonuclease subunit S n=1 Tax=Phaeobacter inhibens TaxID=221822 RepID=UPI0021A68F42|nr:restriction endonuclease subunit S [Phaeobacter inhibens]UWR92926.1 restriction endonuclease subunit S [Phaeobacter inhibens]